MAKTKTASAKPRQLKQPAYRHFRPSKRIKHPAANIAGSFKLFKRSLAQLASRPKLFAGIILIHAILTVLLVRGAGGGLDAEGLRKMVSNMFNGQPSELGNGLATLGLLISSGGQTSAEVDGIKLIMVVLIVSLALVWALRQVSAGKSVTARMAFYKGMYPLAPFVLVLTIIGFQLTPLIIGASAIEAVANNNLAVTVLEKLSWGIIFFVLATISLYMLCASIFALYIVTLPNMTPMRALRSARQLVNNRRWIIMRRLIMLPIIMLIAFALVLLPIILVIPAIGEWLFFAASIVSLAVIQAYIYSLYRELLA